MALVSSKELLRGARANGYMVDTFSAENMEMMQAVITAAEAEYVPVILQTMPSTLKHAELAISTATARVMAGEAPVPVAMHPNHGNRLGLCQRAVPDGYTSLVIDSSKLLLDENIILARRVVEIAGGMSSRSCVETELGKLGGKEDDLGAKPDEDLYTGLGGVARFAWETGIDSLAVVIGAAYGFYKDKPRLVFERLTQIWEVIDTPLVSHGSSDAPDEDVQRAVSMGVRKISFATELRTAYTQALWDCPAYDAAFYDPKKYGGSVREAAISLVQHHIKICAGKVGLTVPL